MSAFVELSCFSAGSALPRELRDDALGQHLAQLDAPLVERVDVPDHALREHDVLVERDQLAERRGRQSRQQQRVGRPVALERAMGDQPVGRAFGSAPPRASCRTPALRPARTRWRAARRGARPSGLSVSRERDEVARDEPRALVDQLIEGVLAVGARLAPVDRAGVVRDLVAVERHVLAVALHRQLLEVGGEALEVLLVRQHRDRLRAEEVGVPDAEQPHQHRQVPREAARCGSARPSRGSRRASRGSDSGPIASIVERPIADSIE